MFLVLRVLLDRLVLLGCLVHLPQWDHLVLQVRKVLQDRLDLQVQQVPEQQVQAVT